MWFDNLEKPILILAPMADLTDQPFSRLCREVAGSDFVIFREMVSAEAITRGNKKTLKMCEFDKWERPVVLQIFGARPTVMSAAAVKITELFKPDGLDINMGCPVPKIAERSQAGAALMRDPDLAAEIVHAVKSSLPMEMALSVKIRLGWSDKKEALNFAVNIEKAGADLITVHGRTKNQGYGGQADWEMIAAVKKNIAIPVIANGDVVSAESARRCLSITGADGLMVGRGALGNPWSLKKLSRLNQSEVEVNPDEVIKVVLRHARLHVDHYGERGIVTFRKHLGSYFKGWSGMKEKKTRLMRVETYGELVELLEDISSGKA